MIETSNRLTAPRWATAAATALIGCITLFDAPAGLSWPLWIALTVAATLVARRNDTWSLNSPRVFLAIAAVVTAFAMTRTTDTGAHVGIVALTAVLLAVFLCSIEADNASVITVPAIIASPFLAVARVATAALTELGLAARSATGPSSKPILRRVLLVSPVVIVLIILLGGADPIIHTGLESIARWFPELTLGPQAVFFGVLFVVTIGAFSRLPNRLRMPAPNFRLNGGPTPRDGAILVASTFATLAAFPVLQIIYLFVRLPGDLGNGVTYADYARRGFGELCVVVTIVAGVILFAEKLQRDNDARPSASLKTMEFATIAAAALILISAQRRIGLYEQAYGYTVARVQATAFIVFLAGFLVLLTAQLRSGRITPALGRRSASLALVVVLAVLYWNDQAWIMNRNIDRIHTTGKFDEEYAATLSPDAFPAAARRRSELPPADWDWLKRSVACKALRGPFEWYDWNGAREEALFAREAQHIPEVAKCPARRAATEPPKVPG